MPGGGQAFLFIRDYLCGPPSFWHQQLSLLLTLQMPEPAQTQLARALPPLSLNFGMANTSVHSDRAYIQ